MKKRSNLKQIWQRGKYRSGWLMDTTDPVDLGTAFAVAYCMITDKKLEEVLHIR